MRAVIFEYPQRFSAGRVERAADAEVPRARWLATPMRRSRRCSSTASPISQPLAVGADRRSAARARRRRGASRLRRLAYRHGSWGKDFHAYHNEGHILEICADRMDALIEAHRRA